MTEDGPRAAHLDPTQTRDLSTAGFDNQASERSGPKTKSNNQPKYRQNHLSQAGLQLISV
jgi:hypothetical protein